MSKDSELEALKLPEGYNIALEVSLTHFTGELYNRVPERKSSEPVSVLSSTDMSEDGIRYVVYELTKHAWAVADKDRTIKDLRSEVAEIASKLGIKDQYVRMEKKRNN